MKDIIIKTNGEVIQTEPFDGKCYSLDELRNIVGGFIEIEYKELTDNKMMVINLQGKRYELPYNKVATALYKSADPDFSDKVVGDVLVCDSEHILKF